MRVFLSTSFTNRVDQHTGQILDEYKTFVGRVLETLRASEGEVFCAVEAEDWKMNSTPPELTVQQDLQEIDAADVLLALVDDQISAGVQFELGYAVGKGKKVIIAKPSEHPLAYFNQGAVSSGLIMYVSYDNAAGLLQQLPVVLHAPESEI
ncbi:MAG: nucleoside 2-deoxyribosyltransferase [Candidatus Saccharimonadales bacterium]